MGKPQTDIWCTNREGRTPLQLAWENREDQWGGPREAVVAVIHWILTEHYQEGRVSEELLKEMLFWSCRKNFVDVAKALLEAGADPNCVSAQQQSPLDVARSSECIRLLLAYGANPSNIYEACRKHLPSSCPTTPEEPSVKVFIVGDSGAGKSTLTESLKKDISGLSGLLARVNPVSAEKKTAGIVPHKISSSKMGRFQVYDLAGDKEFYSSHDAIIATSLSGPSSAVFLLVVDLRSAPDDISRTLHYWLDFLQSKLSQNCSKPHLTIVGSHFDKMVQSEFRMKMERLTSIQERAQSRGFEVKDVIAMNCLIAKSDGMTKLHRSLRSSYKSLRPQAPMAFHSHCFHISLVSLSKDKHAVQISTILEACKEQPDHDVHQFLPRTAEGLCTLCDDLSERSLILFFKNEAAIEKSWIIIDQAALLSRVNGTVFASEGTKTYCELSTSMGVVSFSTIAAEFADLDPNMITKFLKHLQFCIEIGQEALKVIEPDTTLDQKERHFFFPNLVRELAPTDVWVEEERFTDYSGWQVECYNPKQLFSARFLQLLLLRVAFQHALPLSSEEATKDHPALQRTCKIWQSGLYWENEDLLSALVEIPDPGRKVNILIRCQQGRTVHVPLLRSRLVQDVLKIRNEVCRNSILKELILHPQAVKSYPIDASKEQTVWGAKLAMAIARNKEGAFNLSHGALPINELLLCDPYSNDEHIKHEIEQLLERHSISNAAVGRREEIAPPKQNERPKMAQLEQLTIHGKKVIKIITEVAGRWDKMARRLNFSEGEVEILQRNHANDAELACTDLFNRWLKGNHRQPVSWHTVVECLREVDLKVAAEHLSDIIVD